MREVTAGRTLVKSPPELWAVCSVADSLAQHLEVFGEIRITRLEPETTVAWEGERASGTVRIEPAGWGTKVTVTAAATEPTTAPAPTAADPERTRRPRFLARLFGGARAAVPQDSMIPLQPDPGDEHLPANAAAALEAALESLGQAHRRPFSR
jgi:hypothetical protein